MVAATKHGKVYEVAGETVVGPRKRGESFGVNIESIRPSLAEAERFVRWFTEQVILEDIQHPVTVQIGGQKSTKKDALAHFSSSRLVSKKDAKEFGVSGGIYGGWQTREGVAVHEIMLVAEVLSAEPIEIMHRLAHEVVHLWQAELDEKGTAKSGRHNKLFVERAESVGLVVVESDKQSVGFTTTGFTDEMRARIENEFKPDAAGWQLFKSQNLPRTQSRKSTVALYDPNDEDAPVIRIAAGKVESALAKLAPVGYEIKPE